MKRISVTIGIPAYQSQDNIVQLLRSLLNQIQKGVNIEKIIVYADGCTDKTVPNAKSVKSKKIQIINSGKNQGFAYALQSLIKRNKSQIFVGLNDDIRLDSKLVISELAKKFSNKNTGLVGGNIKALKPTTFIGRCIYASYLVFEQLRYSIKKGNTDLTCDGKIFAISNDFAKTLNLAKTKVGNVDIFLYYENLRQKRRYAFAKKAEVKFRLPETIEDFKSQEIRSQISRKTIQERFGSLFTENHKFSKFIYFSSVSRVFIKYPLETIIFKILINSRLSSSKKNHFKWKLALTTKKLAFFISEIGI